MPIPEPAPLPRVLAQRDAIQPRVHLSTSSKNEISSAGIPTELPRVKFNLPSISIPTSKSQKNYRNKPQKVTQPPPRAPFQLMHRYRTFTRNFRSAAVQVLKAQAMFSLYPAMNHIYNSETGKRNPSIPCLKAAIK